MVGTIRNDPPGNGMQTQYPDFNNGDTITEAWADDININLDDKVSKTDTTPQSIAGALTVTGQLTAPSGMNGQVETTQTNLYAVVFNGTASAVFTSGPGGAEKRITLIPAFTNGYVFKRSTFQFRFTNQAPSSANDVRFDVSLDGGSSWNLVTNFLNIPAGTFVTMPDSTNRRANFGQPLMYRVIDLDNEILSGDMLIDTYVYPTYKHGYPLEYLV